MIELNLLPEELKKKKTRIELPEISIIPIAIIFAGSLVIIQLILGGLIFLGKRQIANLDKKWQELAPKKKEFDTIKAQITATDRKVKAIEGLIEKQLNWSRLLNELSNSLTANIWLTDLSYSEKTEQITTDLPAVRSRRKAKPSAGSEFGSFKTRKLTLSGSAAGKGEETTALIAHFIKSLKENEGFFMEFDNIELISIKKGQVGEQDIMNFTLVSSFKPETSSRKKEE